MKFLLLALVFLAPALTAQAGGSFFRQLVQSADRGAPESPFVLGLAYGDGWDGIVRVGSFTAKWCEMAAELGDQRPALVLGLLQEDHEPVAKDTTEAVKWLRLAAERGDNYAQVILGDMLLEGDGVPADWRSGADLIRKSAYAGFVPAQFRLGVIYLVGGQQTPKDEIEALAWFIVAAESGSEAARTYRDERTRLLGRDAARLAIKRSRDLLPKSAQTGNRARS